MYRHSCGVEFGIGNPEQHLLVQETGT